MLRRRLILIGIFLVFASSAPPAATRDAKTSHTSPPLRPAVPIAFEENAGQADPSVRYLARNANYSLFLTAREITLARGNEAARMTFRGANPRARMLAEDRMAGVTNYLLGDDPSQWRLGVPTYGKVRYDNLYRGIDLVFYGNDRQLEYDLIVQPGADPRSIRLDIEGTGPLRTSDDGAIVARTGASEIRFRAPVLYQESGRRMAVTGRYRLVGDRSVAFDIDAYDRTKPLVIDPVVVYATYLSGNGTDDVTYGGGQYVAVDSTGAAYVTGVTDSSNFPTTAGAWQTQHIVTRSASGPGGPPPCTVPTVSTLPYLSSFAFITKLSPDGSSLLYSTYFGGTWQYGFYGECGGATNAGHSIAIDSSGNAYVTGFTNTADFPLSGGDAAPSLFVVKLNPTGSGIVYAARIHTPFAFDLITQSSAIAVGVDGSAYVTGGTRDTNFPTTPGAFQEDCAGCSVSSIFTSFDAFVFKLHPTGLMAYATYLGGSGGSTTATGIAVDSFGQASVTGKTTTPNFPTTFGAVRTTAGTDAGLTGGSDVFVTKLSANGSALVFSTYLNGDGRDVPGGVANDASGNVYVTGGTASNNFPTTAGALQPTFAGGTHAFVTKLLSTGALEYSTYLGGSNAAAGDERGVGIGVDLAGRAYVAGNTDAANFPLVDEIETAMQSGPGQPSVFLSVLNAAGSALDFSTYLGGTSGAQARAVAVSNDGSAYIVGAIPDAVDGTGQRCCQYPTTSGAFQTGPSTTQALGGFVTDVFVTRVRARTILPPACSGATASTSVLWPPNHSMVAIGVLGLTDPQDEALTVQITGIQQDEATEGLGDGDIPIDGGGVGTSQASVRSERSAKGDGRVYAIAFRATNTDGASCTGTVFAGVPQDQKPGRPIADSLVRYDSTVAGGSPLP